MTWRSWGLVAAMAAWPGAAAAETLADQFLDLVQNACVPAIETAEAPDLAGLTPYDRDNPDHNFLGPFFSDAHVLDDPRLLVAYGERNGYRGCEVSFAEEMPGADGATISDALDAWIYRHIDGTDYTLVENCAMFGFKLFVAAGSTDRNPRGHYVRILATAGMDPDDEAHYGNPRVIVGETAEPSTETCIEDADTAQP